MNHIDYPRFAVVGHPNKGKSSIVASLAMDDAIAISDTPGTTTRKARYPLKVDGETLYELIDTPGFQRARQVLAWLREHETDASRRHEVVREFVNIHKGDARFHDEIELLEPIMEGAGIIYVVDGSKPYGEEYEAEMEILRWTGQPSMALINRIDEEDYTEDWKRALGGYFQMIRTYDPIHATLSQHLKILESMAQLREEWTPQVKASIALFERYHAMMRERSAAAIAKLLYRALSHVERLALKEGEAVEDAKKRIASRYKQHLRSFEVETQKRIEYIWNHQHLKKQQEQMRLEGLDLFSKESASVFGLTRKELLVTGASSGAVTGAGIDLAFAGHTFFAGGIIGAVVGGVGAYMAFNELADIKVLGRKIGRRTLQMGPMQNRNFPYILLGRILFHTTTVAQLSHAVRHSVNFEMDEHFRERWLTDTRRKKLEKYHKQFRQAKRIDENVLAEYEALVLEILNTLLGEG